MRMVEGTSHASRTPLRWSLLALMALSALAGGCGKRSLPPEQLASMQQVFDDAMLDKEPLCILAGPFPYRAGPRRPGCDRCQDLEAAGFLTRRVVDTDREHYVEYALSPQGEPLYRVAPDPEWVASLERRQQKTFDEKDLKRLERPRMCFGTTRFHGVADALAPLHVGSGRTVVSVKLVAEARDSSGLLFDPRLAALRLPVPPRPEPGQLVLYPERVVTFQSSAVYGALAISDMRYGRWANEP